MCEGQGTDASCRKGLQHPTGGSPPPMLASGPTLGILGGIAGPTDMLCTTWAVFSVAAVPMDLVADGGGGGGKAAHMGKKKKNKVCISGTESGGLLVYGCADAWRGCTVREPAVSCKRVLSSSSSTLLSKYAAASTRTLANRLPRTGLLPPMRIVDNGPKSGRITCVSLDLLFVQCVHLFDMWRCRKGRPLA